MGKRKRRKLETLSPQRWLKGRKQTTETQDNLYTSWACEGVSHIAEYESRASAGAIRSRNRRRQQKVGLRGKIDDLLLFGE